MDFESLYETRHTGAPVEGLYPPLSLEGHAKAALAHTALQADAVLRGRPRLDGYSRTTAFPPSLQRLASNYCRRRFRHTIRGPESSKDRRKILDALRLELELELARLMALEEPPRRTRHLLQALRMSGVIKAKN